MSAVNKVLFNNAQSLSPVEQALARSNIGASKVGLAALPTSAGNTSEAGTSLTWNFASFEAGIKCLVLISVYTTLSLQDTSTPADLQMLIEAPPAFKLGGSDGDTSLSNTSCSYSGSSVTALRKFSTFSAVLNAGESIAFKGTFSSSVAGINAEYAINYTQLSLE